ncbi:MAG: NAD(P)H-binding protein [Rhodobacteraceae bacterium]|nr:NAD(P)H-binding protein [Paracoccaceae bacterium]
MRVLVLGASGFIGGHVTAALRARGHRVVGAARNPEQLARRQPGVDVIMADFRHSPTQHPDFWAPHLSDVDAIVNAAGVLQSRRDAETWAVNLLAPRAVAQAALQDGRSRRFIQISTVGIEADSPQAAAKNAMEEALIGLGGSWTILRPSLVYGETASGATALIRSLSATPWATVTPGSHDAAVDPIHVEDFAELTEIALHEPRLESEIVEVGGPERLYLSDLQQGYRAWFGLPPARKITPPDWLAKAAAKAGDWLSLSPLCTASLSQLETTTSANQSERLEEIRFRPRAMSDALPARPAGAQDRWHARLYLWRPALRLGLALMWIFSGVLALIGPATAYAPLTSALSGLGPLKGLADASVWEIISRIGGLLELGLGYLLLRHRGTRQLAWTQLGLLALYAAAPGLGALPVSLAAALPLVILIMIHRTLEEG